LIIPEPPSEDIDLASWLSAFMEGLGVSRASILASDSFCIPALELALLEGDQVARIVLVPHGGGRLGEAGGTIITAGGRAGVPLLVIQRGQPASATVPAIMAFLGEVSGSAS
jgi:hypothetical protein